MVALGAGGGSADGVMSLADAQCAGHQIKHPEGDSRAATIMPPMVDRRTSPGSTAARNQLVPDIKAPDDAALLHRLATADVLFRTSRPGRPSAPDSVRTCVQIRATRHVHISGYGEDEPCE